MTTDLTTTTDLKTTADPTTTTDRATRRTRPFGRRGATLVGAAAIAVALASCGGDDDAVDDIEQGVEDVTGAVSDAIDELGEDTVELAARNLASAQAADEFADAGYPIDGSLSCTADATDDLTAVDLDCTGATEDGGVASMTGTTTELPGESLTELEGDFVGFVDNEEVFRTGALG